MVGAALFGCWTRFERWIVSFLLQTLWVKQECSIISYGRSTRLSFIAPRELTTRFFTAWRHQASAVCSMADIWIEGTFGPLFVGIAHELVCSRNRLFFAGKVGPGGRVVYKMLLLASARSWLEASLGMTLDLKAALDTMFTESICLVPLTSRELMYTCCSCCLVLCLSSPVTGSARSPHSLPLTHSHLPF